MNKSAFLSRLGLFASFFALAVIALGAFTRLVDAGLGCPDWPGCYGHLVAPMSDAAKQAVQRAYPSTTVVVYKAWAEMMHRYFVAGLSGFISVIIGMILTQRAVRDRHNGLLAIGLFTALLYQIGLGQLTVTLKLFPLIVSQHLLGGFFILSLLWLVCLHNQAVVKRHVVFPTLVAFAYGGVLLLLLQICLGAWTSTNYAALSCSDLPFCMNDKVMTWRFAEAFTFFRPIGVNYDGGILPEAARQTIQMVHRIGAVVVASYLLVFSAVAMSRGKKIVAARPAFVWLLGLLCVQLCLGMTNVLFKLPLIPAIAHNIVAALLLLSLLTVIFRLTSERAA